MRSSVTHLHFLNLAAPGNKIIHGCNQDWYRLSWQRRAGCGPTTATNLLIYHQRAGRLGLAQELITEADGLALMEQVWHYVKPTAMGVHTPGIFHSGLQKFLKSRGVSLQPQALLIPRKKDLRPTLGNVVDFIRKGLEMDSPVAFLNLSNGSVRQLDKWHWVTVTAIDDSHLPRVELEICDNLNRFMIDLKEWYDTTHLGGGFVYLA
jgi:hypothetical protein